MKKLFGTLPSGETASLYTISCGGITAAVTDYGAHLVKLLVPDRDGNIADVVLGYDDPGGYRVNDCFFGAIVGRNANRVKGAAFPLNGKTIVMGNNENGNNLHSGPDFYRLRLWQLVSHRPEAITLRLNSPDGDQGFPGNAVIDVTYELDEMGGLHIVYDATCDRDTVFNMTNHSYFNLVGHEKTALCMDQLLCIPGSFFAADDAQNIPTGELRDVAGTPFDFHSPKPIGRDIEEDYDQLKLQGGYDHSFEVYSNPCAILEAPDHSRSMMVFTDCPGIQVYAGNFIPDHPGKDGVRYCRRCGVALETQFFPDSVHHPEWPQPAVKAGTPYHSETVYKFMW